ncbi:MAG: hypothetical protein F6K47_25390 [Symploca sp. SIO2E6]|nr:hypothetical protein [Symploca sp. SIO2E6]
MQRLYRVGYKGFVYTGFGMSGYYGKAFCYARQGEIAQAIDNLKKAIDIAPRLCRTEAKHNPDFDSIRDEEGFRALVEKGECRM